MSSKAKSNNTVIPKPRQKNDPNDININNNNNNNLKEVRNLSKSCHRIMHHPPACEPDVAHEILPNLWLGSKYAASCFQDLKDVGITSIINACASEMKTSKEWDGNVLNVEAEDEVGYDLERHLEDVVEFVWRFWSGVEDLDVDLSVDMTEVEMSCESDGCTNHDLKEVAEGEISQSTSPTIKETTTVQTKNINKPPACTNTTTINQPQKRGGVLIHCKAGVSRSAALLAAVISKLYVISRIQALRLIQQKRHIVDPNSGFMRWLALEEEEEEC